MKWLKLIFNILFSIVGWISSVLSLYKIESLNSEKRIAIVFVVGALSILYVWIQIYSFYKANYNSSIHNSKEKVNKYLLNWLNRGSRTVIFTRDLTWANESTDILNTLERKARNKELTICLYQRTQTTDHLSDLGADIYIHNLSESQLKSRFTIIDYGKNNPKITVGTRNSAGQFVNERYDMNTNPNACNAFIELFELVKTQKISEENLQLIKHNGQ